jgi:type II secretory pathway component HofQ
VFTKSAQDECGCVLSPVVSTKSRSSAATELQQRVLPVSNKSGRVQQRALPRRASAAAEVQQRVLPVFFLVVPTKSVLSVHRAPLRRVHQALVPCAVCPTSAQYPQVYKHGALTL